MLQVSIKEKETGNLVGAGAIINPQYVLTTAEMISGYIYYYFSWKTWHYHVKVLHNGNDKIVIIFSKLAYLHIWINQHKWMHAP